MVKDSNRLPFKSSNLIIIMLAAIVLVMIATVALNGGTSAPPVEENVVNNTNSSNMAVDYALLGNNSYGTVTKTTGYGNPASDIHVAFILGVDSQSGSQNAIVPTLKNETDLKYSYDVYVIDTSTTSNNSNADIQDNLTANQKSESLAAEFVVPDIINNNYNFTADIHNTNDSNSYVFVPSDNTYTSKIVVETISNNTHVGRYTPDKHAYTESISESIIDYEIPSIVYVTRDYYVNGVSGEISSIIQTIDNFDFVGLFSSDSTSSTNGTVNNTDNTTDYNTITVSNRSGNKEV